MGAAEQYSEHIPVLRDLFVTSFFSDPDGHYVDCTFGRGGHSRALLQLLSPQGRLLALDRDSEAVAEGESLAREDSRFSIRHADFARIADVIESQGWDQVNGIGFDLGISSPQVDNAKRGFSFQQDGPLDMRMDISEGLPLSRMLEKVSERELEGILRNFGDERYARRIARSILKAQQEGRLHGTADLEAACFHAVPKQARYGKTHPATRSFQALRIWVNNEMTQIEVGVRAAVQHLLPGGKLAVISFHSGEDRCIRDLIEEQVHPCVCPPEAPYCMCGKLPTMRWLQKKPIRPDESEVDVNPRSRSSRLRIAQRLSEAEAVKMVGYSGVVS